ncbi:MAG TPA: hypothetical protein VJH89_02095, partial [Patescibacteria group bacterium]|nr:hypothetical protein [Patescibacteria group bacterium]
QVREALLGLLANDDTRAFLEQHPLFFFLMQAGGQEPLDLIDDATLKSKATKLIFHTLELPDFIGVSAEEKTGKMLTIANEYMQQLIIEITKREKLLTLERLIREARDKQDKALEKKLVAEFTEVSLDK